VKTLTNAELGHFKFLLEELLFRLKEDDELLISDLEDEIRICAEIVGLNPNLERDNDE
jgi:hypothetical protein